MKQNRLTIDHPLWDRLRTLNKVAARRFTAEFDKGLGSIGLILNSQPQHGGYWCTPINSVAFAGTGGDGVHFSFLVQDGKVTEKSPIVMTVPEPSDTPNSIVGEDLFDFLCLGYHRGYFALATLPSDTGFAAYQSAEWQPKENWHYSVGYGVDDHSRKLLDFLIAGLGLSPWKDLKGKFLRLQELYMKLLNVRDFDEYCNDQGLTTG